MQCWTWGMTRFMLAERPPMISVEVLPGDRGLKGATRHQQEPVDAEQPASQMQAQPAGEEQTRLGRKRRRKGELPPKLAAILANERSSEEVEASACCPRPAPLSCQDRRCSASFSPASGWLHRGDASRGGCH